MKKFLSLVLALLVVLSFAAVPVSAEGAVFKVGSASFADLDDAITIAKRQLITMTGDATWKSTVKDYYSAGISISGGGHTIKVEENISICAGTTVQLTNVTIDLGGKHFITVSAGGKVILGDGATVTNGGGSYGGAFTIGGDGAMLTLTGTSKITGSTAKTASAIAVGKGASLKLEGGTITGNKATENGGGAIRAVSGSTVSLSGTASVTGNTAPDGDSNLVITDTSILKLYESFKGNVGVSLTSGNEKTKTFGQFAGDMGGSRLYSDQDKSLTAVIAEDGSLVWGETAKATAPSTGPSTGKANGTENKTESTAGLYNQSTDLTDTDRKQAEAGNKFKTGNVYHSDLATAISSSGGKTITMIGDSEWTGATRDFYSSQINIDGNGFTLKLPATILINSGSVLTLKNVNVDLAGKCFKLAGSGHIVLDAGSVLKNGANDFGGAISAEGTTSKVTMKPGSKITGAKGKIGAGIGTLVGATVELLGGIVENGISESNGAVFICAGATVTIGGDFTTKDNKTGAAESGVEITSPGSLTMTGTFTGSAAITVPNATSGAVIGTETGGAKGTEKVRALGTDLVVVTDGKGGLKLGKAGTSTASKENAGASSSNSTSTSTNTSANLTAAEKKQAESGNKFKVGNVFHADMATAINSAGGATITLIGDAEWNGAVKDFYSSKINIDGNGFTLTLPSIILINSGSVLTLKNINVDLSGKCFKIAGSGQIVLDDGAVLKNGANDFGGAISAEGSSSKITMKKGSKITGAKGKVGAGIGTLSGATVELLGGTIENGMTDSNGAVFINSGAKVTLGGDFTLKNNKSGGAEGGIEITDEGALTVKGTFTGSAGIKVPNATSGAKVGTETGGAKGTEKIYVIGTKLVVVTDGKGGLKLGNAGSSTVSDASKLEKEDDSAESGDAVYYDKTGWTATANSVAPGREAPKAIDGSYTSVWHTEYGWENNQVTWKTPLPHNLDVDFGKSIAVAGFTLVTNPGAPAGQPTDMEFYLKINGEYKLVKEYKYNITTQSFSQTIVNNFNAAVMAEGVRLVYLDALDGHGTLAELEIIKPVEGIKAEPFDDFLETMGKNEFYPIPMEKSSVTYDGENWGNNVPDRIMDGQITTFWQANTNMKAPYNLVVDFGDIYTVNGFAYTTRQTTWYDGYWDSYNIYTSDDGKEFTLLYEKQSFLPRSLSRQEFIFDKEVTTRFFKFEILAGTGNLCSVAELEFLEDFDSYKERRAANEESYTLTIGSTAIAHKNGTTELDVAPYIENGTTFIPLRGLLELMGAAVEWDGEVNAVDIKKGTTEIYLQIRNKNVYVTTMKEGKQRYTLTTAPRITDSRTFIPIRFVSEMLGYNVSWNAETREVGISK